MELSQLETFLAVAEERSFSRAARGQIEGAAQRNGRVGEIAADPVAPFDDLRSGEIGAPGQERYSMLLWTQSQMACTRAARGESGQNGSTQNSTACPNRNSGWARCSATTRTAVGPPARCCP